MIEEAFISGNLGKVIYLESQRYFQVSVEDLDAAIECYPMDLSKFLAFGADFTTLSNGQLTVANLKRQLVAQHEERRALTLTISGMDRILDHGCRVFAITTAESLTENPATYHFVRARLLARPAHPEADLETAIAIATEAKANAIGALYRFVLDQDRALALVYETWVRAAYEHFASYAERVKTQQVFTDLGVFADMSSALASNKLKALNSLVVTYGHTLEASEELSRGVHLLNDLKTRLTREWAPSNKRKTNRQIIVSDFEEATSTNDLSGELIAHFNDRQEKPRRKTFTADEAKEKVDHQIAAISKLIEQGNTNRANSYLRDLINFHVEHSEREHLGMSLCSLAKVAIDASSFELAEKLVNYSLMLGIDDVVIFNTQAEMFKSKGDFDKALALYEETIRRFPNSVVARNGYAEVLRATGDFDKALALYEDTIQLFPDDVPARNGYAELLRATGDFDKALALYAETIQLFPNDVFARSGYAEVLRATGDFDKALALYEESIGRFPFDVVARNGYAEVLKATGNFDKALALYEETIQLFPNDVVARNGLGNVLVLMNKFDEARSILPTQRPRSIQDWIAYHIKAMSYLREGSVDEAIRRLTYGLENTWPIQKKYFATALAVAKIRKNEFADIPRLLPLNVVDIDFAQRQIRLILVGHSQAALGQTEEAVKTINQLKSARNPQVINLAEAISRRYRLGKYSSLALSKADINVLESTIYDQEFRLAA